MKKLNEKIKLISPDNLENIFISVFVIALLISMIAVLSLLFVTN